MGRYKSVWSCELQHCKTYEFTIIAWEIEGKFKIQQKDTRKRISFVGRGCRNVYVRFTCSTGAVRRS